MNKGYRLARCWRMGVLWHSEPRARASLQGKKNSKIRKYDGLGLSHLLGKFVGAARERPYREGKNLKLENLIGES